MKLPIKPKLGKPNLCHLASAKPMQIQSIYSCDLHLLYAWAMVKLKFKRCIRPENGVEMFLM